MQEAAEWLPARNRRRFAARVVEVRRAYGLAIDRREADALDRILARCESTAMEPLVCHTITAPARGADTSPTGNLQAHHLPLNRRTSIPQLTASALDLGRHLIRRCFRLRQQVAHTVYPAVAHLLIVGLDPWHTMPTPSPELEWMVAR